MLEGSADSLYPVNMTPILTAQPARSPHNFAWHCRAHALAGSALLAMLSAAVADSVKVGLADTVRNDVASINGATSVKLNAGDDVARDDVVQTKDDSDAKIVLLDDTRLSIGPRSSIKIDKAVYSTETSYSEIGIKLTQGAFRFITGASDKKAYKIETPTATIGVRGTILDIRIQPSQTLVTLQDGEAAVCAGSRCVQLLQRGHTANITLNNGAVRLKRDLTSTWTFASVCSGNASLCSPLPPLVKRASLPATAPNNFGTNLGNALTRETLPATNAKPLRRVTGPAQVPAQTLPERGVAETGQPGGPSVVPALPSVPAAPSLPTLRR